MSCEYQIRVFFFFKDSVFYWLWLLFDFFYFYQHRPLVSRKSFFEIEFDFMTLIERFFNDYCQTETVQTANQNKIRYYRNHQEFKEKQANRCNLRLFLAVHCLGRRLARILYTKNAKLMQSWLPFENRNKIALQQQLSNDSWLVCVSYHTNMFKYALRTFI